MSTLRELAAESIGRITRKTLEPQLTQIEAAMAGGERAVAVAPGQDLAAGVALLITDRRLLISRGAPFAQPELREFALQEIASATAAPEASGSAWSLVIGHAGQLTTITGMFDRDAQRMAALLA